MPRSTAVSFHKTHGDQAWYEGFRSATLHHTPKTITELRNVPLENGLSHKAIEGVIQEANVYRAHAVDALNANTADIAEALMELLPVTAQEDADTKLANSQASTPVVGSATDSTHVVGADDSGCDLCVFKVWIVAGDESIAVSSIAVRQSP
jgi:hypothetical protein